MESEEVRRRPEFGWMFQTLERIHNSFRFEWFSTEEFLKLYLADTSLRDIYNKPKKEPYKLLMRLKRLTNRRFLETTTNSEKAGIEKGRKNNRFFRLSQNKSKKHLDKYGSFMSPYSELWQRHKLRLARIRGELETPTVTERVIKEEV